MKRVTADMKMADVIHLNYELLPVLNRFGLKLGYREKTVKQICSEHSINIDFLLEIVNTFNDPHYFPEKHLQSFEVDLIINYLRKTHAYYINVEIDTIEKLIASLVTQNSEIGVDLTPIRNFFTDYKNELIVHIRREEVKVFPYIQSVVKMFLKEDTNREEKSLLNEYSMTEFMGEHNDVDEKLLDLKNILIKYLPSTADEQLCNSILFNLFRLERDLKDHTRMENKILIPKVLEMERSLSSYN